MCTLFCCKSSNVVNLILTVVNYILEYTVHKMRDLFENKRPQGESNRKGLENQVQRAKIRACTETKVRN